MSILIPFQTPDGPTVSGGMQVSAPPANTQAAAPGADSGNASMSVPPKDKQKHQQPGCGGDGGGGALMQFGIIAVLVVFMYLFLIRPQQKRQKEHQTLLNALMKGDKVITTGGMLGTIVAINDRIVTLEIADKTRVKILRSYIQGKQFGNIETEGTPAEGDAKKD